MSELHEDLLKEAADADRRGDGWTSDVCKRAAAEIERLRDLVEKLQVGNRVESLEAARACYREGRYEGTAVGEAMVKQWPWLKEGDG